MSKAWKTSEFEYYDMPDDIKKALQEYYLKNDHRDILNDSYTRYPDGYDFGVYAQDDPEFTLTELDQWFLDNGATLKEGHVIIHWNW